MMLSIKLRIKILENNKVYCKYCLRLLTIGTTGNSCGKGRHIQGNGVNGSCTVTECENNVTLCKRHETVNRDRHRLYKAALRWVQRLKPAQNGETVRQESYLMAMAEETESKGRAELNDMNDARKEIHLKKGIDTSDIFKYQDTDINQSSTEGPEQVALAIIEERRKNLSQFDLAYIYVGGEEVLAAFDTCSTATLIHRELIDEGKVEVAETEDEAEINGIGGIAKGRIVELELDNRFGTKIVVVKATVVDEITTL